MRQQGFIAWEGCSPLTGDPIVCVVTGRSMNTKTGPMRQVWVLLRDVAPFDALASGADRAICGDCVHRSGERRTCYVSMFNGPLKVWRTLRAGGYPTLTPAQAAEELRGEYLRIAAYGDPAFLPFALWSALVQHCAGWTGYTHQWRTCDRRFQTLLMASVESETETDAAHAAGWRTFRARPASAPLRADEFVCPASDEGGHRTTCLACQLCRGTSSPARSVAIQLHGKMSAPRLGQRGKYNSLRADLQRQGYSDLRLTPGERSRVVLALSQYYLRHKQRVTFGSRKMGDGLYRFWLDTMASVDGLP